MSDDDPIIDGRPLSTLKVAELKDELEKVGLATKGVKAVLQDRLREFLAGDRVPIVKQESPLVAEYRAKQQKALAEARAADPRNKKVEEDQQVSSTKPAEEVAKKLEEETVKPVEPEPEIPADPEPEPEAEPENSSSGSSSSTSESSSSSSSGASSANSTPRKLEQEQEEENVVNNEKNEEEKIEEEEKEEKEEIEEENGKDEKENVEEDENGDELDYGDEEETVTKEEPVTTAKTTSENGEENDKKEEVKKKETDVEKEEKVREVSNRRATSPSSRHPVSDIVHIRGLVRPFTENNLRAFISSHGGEIVDFWIDKVKSHCFAKLTSSENAAKVLSAMHDTHWPESNQKLLVVVHDTEDNMNRYKEGRGEAKLPEIVTVGSLTGAKRAERLSSTQSSVVVDGKSNLRITVENSVRGDNNLKQEGEEGAAAPIKKERRSLASRLTRIDKSGNSIEIGAAGDASNSTDRKRQRSQTPPFSQVVDEKKNRLDSERLRRPETALKTPDDLFKKTKTLPALYYVPLTDEQVAEKEKRRANLASNSNSTRNSDRDRPRRRYD